MEFLYVMFKIYKVLKIEYVYKIFVAVRVIIYFRYLQKAITVIICVYSKYTH